MSGDSPPLHSSQIVLTTPTTSQSHAGGVSNVPILPLPFIRPQLTRVTFTTSPSPERLRQPLSVDTGPLTRSRSSSYREGDQLQAPPTSSAMSRLDDFFVDTMLSKTRSSSTSKAKTIEHHLQYMENKGHNSSRNFVVGSRDYYTSGGSVGMAEWEGLEREAAAGLRGTLHENFEPSVQVMDRETDNSSMPFTVVNGESQHLEVGPLHADRKQLSPGFFLMAIPLIEAF